MKKLALEVPQAQSGERLDKFIAAKGGISRGEARRALERGGVFVDGRRVKAASRAVRGGQKVAVNLEEAGDRGEQVRALEPARLLFADGALVAVDKPAGVPAQPTLTRDVGTLPDLVAAAVGGKVFLVHRLDRETSGVTVFARTAAASAVLAKAFAEGGPKKTYLALCARAPAPPEGRIELPLGPDPGRTGRRAVREDGERAATAYRTLAVREAALVEARPETGRTHQLRVHLAHLGAPLLGDAKYGGPRMVGTLSIPRVMLHARRLELAHPVTGAPMAFEAPVPEDFLAVQAALVDGAQATQT